MPQNFFSRLFGRKRDAKASRAPAETASSTTPNAATQTVTVATQTPLAQSVIQFSIPAQDVASAAPSMPAAVVTATVETTVKVIDITPVDTAGATSSALPSANIDVTPSATPASQQQCMTCGRAVTDQIRAQGTCPSCGQPV